MTNIKKGYLKGFTISISLLIFTGCLPGHFVIEVERGHDRYYRNSRHYKRIPPGHMPPPGKCRIWYPGVPPGQQPPPGDCYILSRNVPPGAWLIVG